MTRSPERSSDSETFMPERPKDTSEAEPTKCRLEPEPRSRIIGVNSLLPCGVDPATKVGAGRISGRSFVIGVPAAGAPAMARAAQRPVRVAAIQIHPTLADVSGNLERAERLIREAISQGAAGMVLPEFFTSGLAFDPVNLPNAPRPLDGAPTQMLKR